MFYSNQDRPLRWGIIKQRTPQGALIVSAVREFMDESAASAASLVYVKFQAVIKSAASAASLRGGRASGRLDRDFFSAIFGRASGPKKVQILDSVSSERAAPALSQ